MVLHLLGKKSWNVYNTDNVERVRRDEAEARAREEAEEQRMQEVDAERRIAILRGEKPPALPQSSDEIAQQDKRARRRDGVLPRKRRRLRGEDDTDRDIRYARDEAQAGAKAKQTLSKHGDGDAPLLDHAGHLQLIPAPNEKAVRKAEKNADAEAEKAKKRKRDEDQYTMRFSNAAGFKNGMEKPWYAASKNAAPPNETGNTLVLAEVQDKDVWGNEDHLRKDRERNRISTKDPFAAMQHAQQQLKQSERDKERWKKERMAEVEELKHANERDLRHEKKHRRRRDNGDSLEGFSLDAGSEERRQRDDRDEHGRHRHLRHRHHQDRRQRRRSPS